MFGVNFKRQRIGKPIQARTINEPIAKIEKFFRLRVGRGLSLKYIAGIPYIWFSDDVTVGKFAITRSGGIPAMTGAGTTYSPWVPGSASCELCDFNGVNILHSGIYVNVYNSVGTAISGSLLIQTKLIDRYYFVDVAPCTS